MVPPAEPETAPPVVVVGATAAGKSELAVRLARRWGAEVVNADSMQLYRGMDIGTAKLSMAQRQGVPHHLLDVWDVRQPASVAAYQAMASRLLAELRDARRPAVVVGGSGLYVRAVLGDLEFPATDRQLRTELEGELAQRGAAAMHEQLATLDPEAAARILPTNGRRIVRALEVVRLTGRRFTATLPAYHPVDAVQVGLAVPREVLDERIAARVDQMWAQGFVEEVRRLEGEGIREGPTASRALGYAQVLRHLAGECSEEQARDETVRVTRRFVRRQESWFRRDPRVVWLSVDDTVAGEGATDALVDRVERLVSQASP